MLPGFSAPRRTVGNSGGLRDVDAFCVYVPWECSLPRQPAVRRAILLRKRATRPEREVRWDRAAQPRDKPLGERRRRGEPWAAAGQSAPASEKRSGAEAQHRPRGAHRQRWSDPVARGGAPANGGSTTVPSSGGTGPGGTTGVGGIVVVGGSVDAGGLTSVATGGSSPTGDSTSTTAGGSTNLGTGGTTTGTGGSTETSSGGSTSPNEGGQGGGGSDVVPSNGCDIEPTLKNGTIDISFNNTLRQYILRLPNNYDNGNPYRLVFAYAESGSSAQSVVDRDYFRTATFDEENPIFVAPDAENGAETSFTASSMARTVGSPSIPGRARAGTHARRGRSSPSSELHRTLDLADNAHVPTVGVEGERRCVEHRAVRGVEASCLSADARLHASHPSARVRRLS